MKTPIEVKIVDPRIGTQYPLPSYSTPGSAGMDLRAMTDSNITVAPGETILIPTGSLSILPNQA